MLEAAASIRADDAQRPPLGSRGILEAPRSGEHGREVDPTPELPQRFPPSESAGRLRPKTGRVPGVHLHTAIAWETAVRSVDVSTRHEGPPGARPPSRLHGAPRTALNGQGRCARSRQARSVPHALWEGTASSRPRPQARGERGTLLTPLRFELLFLMEIQLETGRPGQATESDQGHS